MPPYYSLLSRHSISWADNAKARDRGNHNIMSERIRDESIVTNIHRRYGVGLPLIVVIHPRAACWCPMILEKIPNGEITKKMLPSHSSKTDKPDVLLESIGVLHLRLSEYNGTSILMAHACPPYLFVLDYICKPSGSDYITLMRTLYADDVIEWHQDKACGHPYQPLEIKGIESLYPELDDNDTWQLVNSRIATLIETAKGRFVMLNPRTSGNTSIYTMRSLDRAERLRAS